MTEQAVIEESEVDAPQQSTEVSDVQEDDLDTLLAQFDESGEEVQEQTEQQEDNELANKVKSLEQKLFEEEYRKDITNVIGKVRGELPEDILDNDFVESWLDAQARKNKKLSSAWMGRKDNPKEFEKVVDALGKQFSKKYGQYFQDSDREAVTSAVRNASKAPPASDGPSEKDISKMTDSEYNKFKRSMLG